MQGVKHYRRREAGGTCFTEEGNLVRRYRNEAYLVSFTEPSRGRDSW